MDRARLPGLVSMADINLRAATRDDMEILWDFLAIAAYEPHAAAAKAVPVVAAHLVGWQQPGDFGFIAERDGVAIGAAWARQFSPDEGPAFYVDERTPDSHWCHGARSGGRGGSDAPARFNRRGNPPWCPVVP